jgi:integrase
MRGRVSGLWRHPRSQMFWFRIAVPERYRARVGKREIKQSLGVTDEQKAIQLAAAKYAETRSYFAQLDNEASLGTNHQAEQIVKLGFEHLAQSNQAYHTDREFDLARAMDNVTLTMLTMLSFRTRLDWGGDYAAQAQRDNIGHVAEHFGSTLPLPGPIMLGEDFRKSTAANIAVFEKGAPTQGAAYRELARALLAARDWQAMEFEVLIVAKAAGAVVKPRGALFDAIAEQILSRLVEHRFSHWPPDIDLVLAPIANATSAKLIKLEVPTFAPDSLNEEIDGPKTLSDAMAIWKEARAVKEPEKIDDEYKLAIARYREFFGTEDLRLITSKTVKAFRKLVSQLPSRPKKDVGALPLMERIEIANRLQLPTLAKPTILKHITCIKSMLSIAVDEEVIAVNPAAGISVDGAKHVGDERDHFSDADIKRIYESPLMTDPSACSDTMFWILLLAPFHGSRPGEHCKLKPHEVIEDDGRWVLRFRKDRRSRLPTNTDANRPRRQKNSQSVRDVPIHWIVEEGGFLEFVEHQIAAGATWLFDDLTPDKYGDRYKYLSRAINSELRRLGITETDKAFYSADHSMKREGRRQRIPEEHLDQAAGHSSGRSGRKYGQGVPTHIIKQYLDELEFRTVAWDPVVACATARVARLKAGNSMKLAASIARSKEL